MLPRVLIVAPRLDIGGAETHLARILPELRRQGLDISVFVLSRGGKLEQKLIEQGVAVAGPVASSSRLVGSIRATHALLREIRRRRPDVLHCFMAEPYLIGSLASASTRGLIRLMSRRSLSYYHQNRPFSAWVERSLHLSVRALLGNSTAVVAQLVDECGAPRKVGLIHNGIQIPPGIEPKQRQAVRRELGISDDTFVLMVIANLIRYKGHQDLLDALALVRERLKGPWKLVAVGRDSGIGRELRKRSEIFGLTKHIVWVDERPDAERLLAAADLALLPSHHEGFSNSLLEKMARGIPVIATRVGGNIDAVVDGVSGRLVPARNPVALGDAIGDLYEDVGLRARLGAAARERVQRHFSLQECVRRYLNLYRGVCGLEDRPVMDIIGSSSVVEHICGE